MSKRKKNVGWAEAKKRCRLNQADIQMAKELGMTPKSLIKNIPSPQEHWKAPVKVWVRELYEGEFGRVHTFEDSREPRKGKQSNNTHDILDEDLPF